MDPPKIYAIAVGITFLVTFGTYSRVIVRLAKYGWIWALKYLIFANLLDRHRFLGPWTRAGVLVHVLYITVNLFCLVFRVSEVSQAGLRAGSLSLINMIPLFAGPHLSFLADLLGISITTYRNIHRSGGIASIVLGLCHIVLSAVGGKGLSVKTRKGLFNVLVSTPMIALNRLLNYDREVYFYA